MFKASENPFLKASLHMSIGIDFCNNLFIYSYYLLDTEVNNEKDNLYDWSNFISYWLWKI